MLTEGNENIQLSEALFLAYDLEDENSRPKKRENRSRGTSFTSGRIIEIIN